jgi:hypothetical protein
VATDIIVAYEIGCFFFEVDGEKTPPLVIFHESSLAGPCSYKQIEEIQGVQGRRRHLKTKKRNKRTQGKGRLATEANRTPSGGQRLKGQSL